MSGEPLVSPAESNFDGPIPSDPTSNDDIRYPHWHKWLSPSLQDGLCNVTYASVGVWFVVTLVQELMGARHLTLLSVGLAAISYILGATVLIGMVSRIQKNQIIAFVVIGSFTAFIWIWPRLAIPGLAGLFGPFYIYQLLYIAWAEKVVHWPNWGVPGYMTQIGPLLGMLNMLLFKGWCNGYLPKILYMVMLGLLMVYSTIKEYKVASALQADGKPAAEVLAALDYRVNLPAAKRLIAFRSGVLVFALGVVQVYTQESMLALLKDDVWQCTPLAI